MLSFPSAVKIYLCKEATDMRRSFDGLAMMVHHIIKQDALSGHIFVFRNKRGNMLKLLYWDKDGYAIWYKRLEKGTFSWASAISEDGVIDRRDFALILEGLDASNVIRKERFSV